jgi:hypothetical protein
MEIAFGDRNRIHMQAAGCAAGAAMHREQQRTLLAHPVRQQRRSGLQALAYGTKVERFRVLQRGEPRGPLTDATHDLLAGIAQLAQSSSQAIRGRFV